MAEKDVKYCTPICKYAKFPEKGMDTSGSCRTQQSLWCNKLEKVVEKNRKCEFGLLEGEEERF